MYQVTRVHGSQIHHQEFPQPRFATSEGCRSLQSWRLDRSHPQHHIAMGTQEGDMGIHRLRKVRLGRRRAQGKMLWLFGLRNFFFKKNSWENQHLSLFVSGERCVPHQWFLTIKSLCFHRWLSDLSLRLINGMIQTKIEETSQALHPKRWGLRRGISR